MAQDGQTAPSTKTPGLLTKDLCLDRGLHCKILLKSESVKCRFSKCRFSVLNLNQKTFRYLWRFYSLLFRGFFVVFSWLFRGPLLSRKTVFGPFSLLFRGFFVVFSWLFRGPRFGQILRVLALEQSSD